MTTTRTVELATCRYCGRTIERHEHWAPWFLPYPIGAYEARYNAYCADNQPWGHEPDDDGITTVERHTRRTN